MGEQDDTVQRISSLPIARGMYVLRYLSAGGGLADHPIATVSVPRDAESKIQVISAPGATAGQLGQPGSCLVVRAESAGDLQISLRRRHFGGSLEASLKLESVSATDRQLISAPLASDAAVETQTMARSPATFSVLAHLARRGDVGVGPGRWVGGPDAPTPIEGIEIRSDVRSEARLEIQTLIFGRPPRWTEWAAPGSFAGSRGLGLPLVGVRLRIVGSDANRFEISADALFLGASVMSKRGRALEFVSVTGTDALVGLRLKVWEDDQQNEKRAVESRRPDREPQVRIFRASATAES